MSKKKILIIDDEESLCRTIKFNLEETGFYEVRTETQGKNALAIAKEYQPDLIILDVIMPDINGCDVALQIQQDEETKGTPILFLTAMISKVNEFFNHSDIIGKFVIPKPVSVIDLITHVESGLGQTEDLNRIIEFLTSKQ